MSEEEKELGISRANFDRQKQELSKIKNELLQSNDFELETIKDKSFFIFDHRVTGEELNRITGQIQGIFIEQNKTINKMINEFDVVFKTFEALDEEYIKQILGNVAGVKKANERAVESLNRVAKQQRQLTQDQSDIRRLVSQQEKVVN